MIQIPMKRGVTCPKDAMTFWDLYYKWKPEIGKPSLVRSGRFALTRQVSSPIDFGPTFENVLQVVAVHKAGALHRILQQNAIPEGKLPSAGRFKGLCMKGNRQKYNTLLLVCFFWGGTPANFDTHPIRKSRNQIMFRAVRPPKPARDRTQRGDVSKGTRNYVYIYICTLIYLYVYLSILYIYIL